MNVRNPWNEALAADGVPRRAWRPLASALGRLGAEELARRAQAGRQLIAAAGITYNVYGSQRGDATRVWSSDSTRAWELDPIPFVLAEADWQRLAEGVEQRARLLNQILADVYGERRILRERLLPPELLFANPQFLRPLDGTIGKTGLHLYAADLIHGPDGAWRVLADRTQAPSGLGYALQNRLVSARTLPAVFNQCRVQSMASFFERVRGHLFGRAERAVLLTPGPGNETYFEHAFLARQWGLTLVEGADLTVRDRRVYLKTLDGLESVDVILRRLDDDFADPLELRGDSLLGVPGLVDAVRAGAVTVANALGSGVMESPAWMAFLPRMARALLGEDLLLASPQTWWCGAEDGLRYVLDHFDDLVIKPTFPMPSGQQAIFPALLSEVECAALRERILSEPARYTAQEFVRPSVAPVMGERGLASGSARPMLLRSYAAATESGYDVLPGGLTRLAPTEDSTVVSIQSGGSSKDTWVLGAAHVVAVAREHVDSNLHASTHETNLEPYWAATPRPTGLPSRVADNFFWLGRYTERAEQAMRLVRALLPALSGEEDFGRAVSLTAALSLLGELHLASVEFAGQPLGTQRWQLERVLRDLMVDVQSPSAIAAHLMAVRRVSWPLKQRLSLDTGRVLEQLVAEFERPREASLDAQLSTLDRGILSLSAFAGLLNENTTRGHGWRFLDLGKRFERALGMLDLLRAALVRVDTDTDDPAMLELLLEVADSAITYRSRYLTALRVESVVALLVLDEANPRSVVYQVKSIYGHLRRFPASTGERVADLAAQAERLLSVLRQVSAASVARPDLSGRYADLDGFVEDGMRELYALADAIAACYFHHLDTPRLTALR